MSIVTSFGYVVRDSISSLIPSMYLIRDNFYQKDYPILYVPVLSLTLLYNVLFISIQYLFFSHPLPLILFASFTPRCFMDPSISAVLSVSTLKGHKKGSPTENMLINQ